MPVARKVNLNVNTLEDKKFDKKKGLVKKAQPGGGPGDGAHEACAPGGGPCKPDCPTPPCQTCDCSCKGVPNAGQMSQGLKGGITPNATGVMRGTVNR